MFWGGKRARISDVLAKSPDFVSGFDESSKYETALRLKAAKDRRGSRLWKFVWFSRAKSTSTTRPIRHNNRSNGRDAVYNVYILCMFSIHIDVHKLTVLTEQTISDKLDHKSRHEKRLNSGYSNRCGFKIDRLLNADIRDRTCSPWPRAKNTKFELSKWLVKRAFCSGRYEKKRSESLRLFSRTSSSFIFGACSERFFFLPILERRSFGKKKNLVGQTEFGYWF